MTLSALLFLAIGSVVEVFGGPLGVRLLQWFMD